MGALEPVTAVAIGVFVFGESFTFRLAIGFVAILAGVTIIIMRYCRHSGYYKKIFYGLLTGNK